MNCLISYVGLIQFLCSLLDLTHGSLLTALKHVLLIVEVKKKRGVLNPRQEPKDGCFGIQKSQTTSIRQSVCYVFNVRIKDNETYVSCLCIYAEVPVL